MSENEDPSDGGELEEATIRLQACSDELLLTGLQRAAHIAVAHELERLAGTSAVEGLSVADFEVAVTRSVKTRRV